MKTKYQQSRGTAGQWNATKPLPFLHIVWWHSQAHSGTLQHWSTVCFKKKKNPTGCLHFLDKQLCCHANNKCLLYLAEVEGVRDSLTTAKRLWGCSVCWKDAGGCRVTACCVQAKVERLKLFSPDNPAWFFLFASTPTQSTQWSHWNKSSDVGLNTASWRRSGWTVGREDARGSNWLDSALRPQRKERDTYGCTGKSKQVYLQRKQQNPLNKCMKRSVGRSAVLARGCVKV